MALPALTPNAITDIDKEVKVNEPVLQLLVCACDSVTFLVDFDTHTHSLAHLPATARLSRRSRLRRMPTPPSPTDTGWMFNHAIMLAN